MNHHRPILWVLKHPPTDTHKHLFCWRGEGGVGLGGSALMQLNKLSIPQHTNRNIDAQSYSGVDPWEMENRTWLLPSGPRAIKAKNILLSFSIFFASCAWSVLNLRHWQRHHISKDKFKAKSYKLDTATEINSQQPRINRQQFAVCTSHVKKFLDWKYQLARNWLSTFQVQKQSMRY